MNQEYLQLTEKNCPSQKERISWSFQKSQVCNSGAMGSRSNAVSAAANKPRSAPCEGHVPSTGLVGGLLLGVAQVPSPGRRMHAEENPPVPLRAQELEAHSQFH